MNRFCIGLLLALVACDRAPEPEAVAEMPAGMVHGPVRSVDTVGLRAAAVPAELQRGAELYQANCMRCHGQAALGTQHGPPLVHMFYEPNHHADIAFFMAAERGVRAHHWNFGDMPPVPEVSPQDVAEILPYVRWLQREAGVY